MSKIPPEPTLPALVADLPDHLYWLTERVRELVRPAAYLVQQPKSRAPLGGTFTRGRPDVPLDAPWARDAWCGERAWNHHDGECFWLQLNLEDIPAAVRRPEWPTVGVAWLTIDLSDDWKARAYFDPRAAASIEWQPREGSTAPTGVSFVLRESPPDATDKTLPEIASDYHGGVGMACDYTDWHQRHYGGRQPSDVQLGGWVWPCQGCFDEVNETVVAAFERQEFGDHGEVLLHYSVERGFFATVATH